jgi:hypothetical protein
VDRGEFVLCQLSGLNQEPLGRRRRWPASGSLREEGNDVRTVEVTVSTAVALDVALISALQPDHRRT